MLAEAGAEAGAEAAGGRDQVSRVLSRTGVRREEERAEIQERTRQSPFFNIQVLVVPKIPASGSWNYPSQQAVRQISADGGECLLRSLLGLVVPNPLIASKV